MVRRPSHETIVDLIEHARPEELELVAWYIKMTKIPKGVDKVIAAWEKKHKEVGDHHELFADTLANLEEQKEEAEAEEAAKKKADEDRARAEAQLLRDDLFE